MAEDRTAIVEPPGRSGGSGWVIPSVLVVALIAGGVFFTQVAGSERARDGAADAKQVAAGDEG